MRDLGYDVIYVAEEDAGISDKLIIERAHREERLILTFDRDYGELIYRENYKPAQGVLYLRLTEFTPELPGRIVHELITVFKLETENRFTVYDGMIIRQRKY